MTPAIRRLAAPAALAAAVGLSACSTPLSSSTTATTAAPTTTTIPGASTPADTPPSVLRARLTYLLVDHVYLLARVTAGIVAGTAPAPTSATTTTTVSSSTTTTVAGAVAPSTTTTGPVAAPSLPTTGFDGDAAAALDANSHDLADLFSAAAGFGPTFSSAFYPLWTARITDIEAYAAAKAGGNTGAGAGATAALAANATALANLFHTTNKYLAVTTLTSTGILDELTPRNTAVVTFVGDQASKATSTAADVVKAAELMYHTGAYLAAASANIQGSQYSHAATSTAANLRSSLTMAWIEHVELASIDLGVHATGGDDGQWAAALSDNTTELVNALSVNVGDRSAQRFGSLWGRYIDALRAYTRAKATGDTSVADAAATSIGSAPGAVGSFFHDTTPGLAADTVTNEVSPIVTGLVAVANAAATGSAAVTATRAAADYVPTLAGDVAEAFAEAAPNLYST
jgi:hypothetical protein